ncbi:MAG: relaxase/mobilization nuclease domain-containing protein, partial [Desulfovibrionaceae bacterium]|nr:relaxase/mobilization nuclease domain-containing protein [Desulfovibrionaceae bacterium]
MILKKIKRAHVNRSKRSMIGGLVNYVLARTDDDGKDKCAWSFGLNFFAATREGQRAEMIALAEDAPRSRMPVAHWLMSWNEDEIPTEQQVRDAVQMFLAGMELDGHQAIVAVHTNTQNIHAHIVVNRVHPDTCEVIQPHNGFDIEAAHKVVAVIEKIQGWEPQKKARYRVDENNQVVRNEPRKKQPPSSRAQDFENNTGEKSAQRIAQQRGRKIFEEAKTWSELHEKLKEVGLRFEKKGSGAIVFVGDIAVKASSVDRAFSMGKLCKRLGEFEEGTYPDDLGKIAPEPVSSVNHEEWKAYRKEFAEGRGKESQTKNSETVRLVERHRGERKRAFSRLAKHGLSVLNIARHCLMVQQRAERRSLRSGRKKARGGKPRFEAWLRTRGLSRQADRWRYRAAWEQERHSPPPLEPETAHGEDAMRELAQFRRYAEAVNAERYRVTCIKMEEDGGKKTFILDKKGGMTRGFSPDELETYLPEMIRLQRRGENIYYTPLSDDRHHILIDDMTRDSLKCLQEDGFRPAVILESSPGNYQCLLTIPKLGTEHDRDVGNRITERLNREYGDKKLCGCIHPH